MAKFLVSPQVDSLSLSPSLSLSHTHTLSLSHTLSPYLSLSLSPALFLSLSPLCVLPLLLLYFSCIHFFSAISVLLLPRSCCSDAAGVWSKSWSYEGTTGSLFGNSLAMYESTLLIGSMLLFF